MLFVRTLIPDIISAITGPSWLTHISRSASYTVPGIDPRLASLKFGHATASLLVGKLSRADRQNSLAAALKEYGAVYLSAIGGAAQYYAKCIEEVEGVDFLDFGVPEAMWHVRVKDFPVIVTMDSHGNSLHADVEKASAAELAKMASPATL